MVGTTLGPYRIDEEIGRGGMGQVYRAHDTTLNREVAVKVLPESLAGNADRLMRFEREAQALAALNHPNIAHIYGLEQGGVAPAIVMELVQGRTLADRLEAGPVPIGEALPIARQIADALEAAHARGIVHRDLKPANVKVRDDGTVKVLDFGLAKALDATPEGRGSGSISPTVTSPAMTAMGLILGTAAYMSPEQAKGEPVDKRADIWAFGVVLFELVSGRRLFEGETVSETLAAVLMKDADWNALPSPVPPKVRRLLQRCLTRDRRNRLQDIGEARIALDEVLAGESGLPDAGSNGAVSTGKQMAWSWLGVGALVGLAAGWVVFSLVGSPKTAPATNGIMRVTVRAFPGLEKTANLAPARDGRYVVYEGHKGDVATLYLHDFESGEVRPIPGTEGGVGPFLSPDGLWLGFHRGRELLKIRLPGGDAVKLCPTPTNFPGATWTEGGTIVFAPGWLQGLWRVPADGGVPAPLTTVKTDAGEKGHWWPRPLPDGRHALFTIWTSGAGLIDSDVAVLDLESGEHRTLFRGADAWFLPPGHIIYYRAGSYHAVAFDTERLEVVGDPVPVLEDATDPMPQGTDELGLAISTQGTLFYLTRQINPPARLAIVTPGAPPEMLAFPARALTSFAVSPNGRIVAASSLESGVVRLRLLDTQSGTDERLDLAGSNWKPTWKPDGSGFAFLSLRKGHFDIYFKDVATDGAEQPIRVTPTDEFPHGWSPDGTTFFFVETQPDGTQPLKVLPQSGAPVESTVLQNVTTKAVALSPDGRWLAYDAERDGRSNVYVRPYKGPGVEVRVSPDGGRQPAWSPDGSELYYVREAAIVANRVGVSQDRFQPGPAEVVFQSSLVAPNNVSEGPLAVLGRRRFLVALREDAPEPPSMHVVLNWNREVAKRLAAR